MTHTYDQPNIGSDRPDQRDLQLLEEVYRRNEGEKYKGNINFY